MLAKKLLRLSLTMRSLIVKPQQICSYHLSNVEYVKDKSQLQSSTNTNGDTLIAELENKSPTEVLYLLEKSKNNINGSHIIETLTNFLKFYKKTTFNSDRDGSVKFNETNFIKPLYSLIESNINILTGSQAVQTLYLLNRLKISELNKLNETVLYHIYKSLDDLSIIDCSTLTTAIKKIPKTELNTQIISCLKRKFIKVLSLNFDETDMEQLTHGLYFTSYNLHNFKVLDIFIRNLQNYKEDFSIKQSILILESFCVMKLYPSGWENVLHKAQNLLLKRLYLLNATQITFIIFILSEKIKTTRMDEFYNPVLFDEIAQKIIDDDLGFENALSVIKCMYPIRHYNKEILNYASSSFFEKTALSGETIDYKVGKLVVLLNGLALANHKSIFWKEMQASLLDYKKLLTYDYKTLCIITLNSICLNHYPIPLLKKLFHENYDFTGQSYLHWSFCKIYQKLKSDPSYNGPMPTETQMKSLVNLQLTSHAKRDRHTYKMLPYLEEGLGNPAYVKTHLVTKNFNFIEHVVVFDKNKVPILINTETSNSVTQHDLEYLEDLKIPSESHVILILFLPNIWYFKNVNQLLTQHKITIDLLKQFSYPIVIMKESTWQSIPEDQKTPYLMNEIHAKIELNKQSESV